MDRALMPGSNTPRPPGAKIQSCPGCQTRTSSRHSMWTRRMVLSASHARAGSTPAAWRECQVANRVRPAFSACSARARTSARVAPGGFSSIRCRPADRASRASVKRGAGGVHRDTAWMSGTTSSRSARLVRVGTPSRSPLRSAAPIRSKRGLAAMAGRCWLRAMTPTPTRPSRMGSALTANAPSRTRAPRWPADCARASGTGRPRPRTHRPAGSRFRR